MDPWTPSAAWQEMVRDEVDQHGVHLHGVDLHGVNLGLPNLQQPSSERCPHQKDQMMPSRPKEDPISKEIKSQDEKI